MIEGLLPKAERLRIILEIGEALAFAHENGAIHRDVKPQNILLDHDGSAKLTDFDLVRAADTTGGTRTAMLGTFLYAAPEAMADASQASEPADVYGLGMTALFAFHGADLSSDVLWEMPELVAKLDIGDACRRVLLKAVARKVNQRWSNVEEFCIAVREAFAPTAEQERRHKKDGSILVYVPGGEFVLGEDKSHSCVMLEPFWIGKYPVTNQQYTKFLGAAGRPPPVLWTDDRFNGPLQPVVGVSWLEAKAYCDWAGFELPTEAQWEAAARGTDGRPYPWGYEPPDKLYADFGKNWEKDKLDPVGSHPQGAGPYAAMDQVGKVWEWCRDAFSPIAYQNPEGLGKFEVKHLAGVIGTVARVIRGGSWKDASSELNVTVRDWRRASNRDQYVGFRVVSRSGLPTAPSEFVVSNLKRTPVSTKSLSVPRTQGQLTLREAHVSSAVFSICWDKGYMEGGMLAIRIEAKKGIERFSLNADDLAFWEVGEWVRDPDHLGRSVYLAGEVAIKPLSLAGESNLRVLVMADGGQFELKSYNSEFPSFGHNAVGSWRVRLTPSVAGTVYPPQYLFFEWKPHEAAPLKALTEVIA